MMPGLQEVYKKIPASILLLSLLTHKMSINKRIQEITFDFMLRDMAAINGLFVQHHRYFCFKFHQRFFVMIFLQRIFGLVYVKIPVATL